MPSGSVRPRSSRSPPRAPDLPCVAALQRSGIALNNDLTVMGIRAEESIWFQVSYIGSRGALGMLPDGALDVRRIDTGRTLAEHIAECGGDPDALRAGAPLPRSRTHCRLSRTSHRAGAEPGRGRAAGRDLHRHPRQLPLSRRAHRGQSRPCRPAAPLPPRRRDGGRRVRHGARPPVGGARGERRADGLHDRPLPHRYRDARPHHRARAPSISAWTCVPTTRRCSAELDRQVDAIIAGIEQRRGVRFHRGPKARAAVGAGRSVDPVGVGAIARPSSTFRCCNSAARPRTMPPPLPPPACRWA